MAQADTFTMSLQHIYCVITVSLDVLSDRMNQNTIMTGAQIKKWRESFGWSQAELARRADTNQQTVDRIERGLTKHSRSAGTISDVISAHLDSLEGRVKKSEAIKIANFKMKASPVPTAEHSFPMFVYSADRHFTLAFYSQIPTAFVDEPGDFSIQIETPHPPLPIRTGDYLFFSSDAPVEAGRIVFAFGETADKSWLYALGPIVSLSPIEVSIQTSAVGEPEIFARDRFHFVSAISIFNISAPLAPSSL